VRLLSLQLQQVRCFEQAQLLLAPGINVIEGPNGAGKTTLLEAAFLLSHGRSFRNGARDILMRRGASRLSVFAELQNDDQTVGRLGLGREKGRWEARMDGEPAALGALVRRCAVVCFEPGTHALIAGGSEERRRCLDWGAFHVEQNFLQAWRRYQRALAQRNALLRAGMTETVQYAPWENELAESAVPIERSRQAYLEQWLPELHHWMQSLLPELGTVELHYRRGWPEEEALSTRLAVQRPRDQARGHTGAGPHRADWTLAFAGAPQREQLSRGQEKLVALGCLLAQAGLYAKTRGAWPIICLDDMASELDAAHQEALVHHLEQVEAQVLITCTELPKTLNPNRLFHVEQGHITHLL
jgi:DNA replication and repair protein RecF